jgi:hypothetical protein
MNFTTPTEIARKWGKIFDELDEAIVLKNNKNIWMLLWWDLAKAVLDSWVLQPLREELWELRDKETCNTIKDYHDWNFKESITMDKFREKYDM